MKGEAIAAAPPYITVNTTHGLEERQKTHSSDNSSVNLWDVSISRRTSVD